jgi:hypothetical protein
VLLSEQFWISMDVVGVEVISLLALLVVWVVLLVMSTSEERKGNIEIPFMI